MKNVVDKDPCVKDFALLENPFRKRYITSI